MQSVLGQVGARARTRGGVAALALVAPPSTPGWAAQTHWPSRTCSLDPSTLSDRSLRDGARCQVLISSEELWGAFLASCRLAALPRRKLRVANAAL